MQVDRDHMQKVEEHTQLAKMLTLKETELMLVDQALMQKVRKHLLLE